MIRNYAFTQKIIVSRDGFAGKSRMSYVVPKCCRKTKHCFASQDVGGKAHFSLHTLVGITTSRVNAPLVAHINGDLY